MTNPVSFDVGLMSAHCSSFSLNKLPQTKQLQQHKFVTPGLWRSEVQHRWRCRQAACVPEAPGESLLPALWSLAESGSSGSHDQGACFLVGCPLKPSPASEGLLFPGSQSLSLPSPWRGASPPVPSPAQLRMVFPMPWFHVIKWSPSG